jgi:Mrp family chromosome partitioning ATPase
LRGFGEREFQTGKVIMGRMLNALRQIDAKIAVGFPVDPAAPGGATARGAKPRESRPSPRSGTFAPPSESLAPEIVEPPSWSVSAADVTCPASEGVLSVQTPAVVARDRLSTTSPESAAEGGPLDRGQSASGPVDASMSLARVDPRYYELAANIVAQLPADHPAALVFTSPGSREGQASVVASLGLVLGRRTEGGVLLIDANFRAPRLASRMGLEEAVGLADVLRGDVRAPRAVRPTAVEGVHLLSAGRVNWGDDEFPDVGQLPEILAQYRSAYPLVLIDAGELAQPEVPRLARYGDGTYLVIRLGVTPRREVNRAIARVKRYGSRVLGCVLVDD